jgi:hypothetical protein
MQITSPRPSRRWAKIAERLPHKPIEELKMQHRLLEVRSRLRLERFRMDPSTLPDCAGGLGEHPFWFLYARTIGPEEEVEDHQS